jgi:hypothetical protein
MTAIGPLSEGFSPTGKYFTLVNPNVTHGVTGQCTNTLNVLNAVPTGEAHSASPTLVGATSVQENCTGSAPHPTLSPQILQGGTGKYAI